MIYEYLFGSCLYCGKYIGKFYLCNICEGGLIAYGNFHDKQDVICYRYNKISRRILLQCKYGDSYYATRFIANAIIDRISKNFKPDFIVPVTTSYYKLLKRGYNPTVEIARIISSRLDIPIFWGAIEKITSSSQRGQPFHIRKQNVKSFVLINRLSLINKKIALLDDLIASGSTIERMINLLENTCTTIYTWSFAKT